MSCACPQCQSNAYKRNGYTRHGKQNHRCLNCGRQFSLEPYSVDHAQNDIESILIEKEHSWSDALTI